MQSADIWPGCGRRAGPADLAGPLTIDLDSSTVAVYGRAKQGAAFGDTGSAAATTFRDLCVARMVLFRGGSADEARGARAS